MKTKPKYALWQRILAMITVIITIALLIAAFVTAVIGSRLYMGFLFAAIIFPILIYVILWLATVLKPSEDNIGGKKEEKEESS